MSEHPVPAVSWYLRSLAPGDVHRGVLEHGRVRAVCGMEFLPLRVSGQAPCSQHPGTAEVIGLVVRGLGDGRIELESHALGGCALTLEATLLFDVLGEWLG